MMINLPQVVDVIANPGTCPACSAAKPCPEDGA
jgi:hypothetical protein